jgi:hypothetical protein
MNEANENGVLSSILEGILSVTVGIIKVLFILVVGVLFLALGGWILAMFKND